MIKVCIACIIIIFIEIIVFTESVDGTLKFTQVIYRHGERTADTTYGIYNELFSQLWPEGRGELTEAGKRQTYEFGRFLRRRYEGFLNSLYEPEDITNWSSVKGRSIKSSLMCMLGLYNSQQTETDNEGTETVAKYSYTPVPIKTIPKERDMFLSLDGTCPRRDELADEISTENFLNFYASNSEMFEYLYNNTGEEFLKYPLADPFKSFKNLYPILDTILLLNDSNKIIEDWMLSEYVQTIIPKIQAYQFNIFKRRAETPESRRLQAGPLVDLITQNFKLYNSGLIKQKMISYSGHDKSIFYLMNSLGIYDLQLEKLPSYANGLFMELHQNPANVEPVIEFWYRNETNHPPYNLISSKCGNPCTLSSLEHITSEFANIDYEKECISKGATQN